MGKARRLGLGPCPLSILSDIPECRVIDPHSLAIRDFARCRNGRRARALQDRRPQQCSESIVGQTSFSTEEEKLEKALLCMQTALHLLDDADAPADIGAHLDLAICRLKDIIAEPSAASDTAKNRRQS